MPLDPFLQSCLDSPLDARDRINHLWRPKGKTTAPESEESRMARASQSRLKSARTKLAVIDRRKKLLDYYAGTAVSFEDVAKHTGMRLRDVVDGLKKRGRMS